MSHHEQVVALLKETFGDQPIKGVEIGTGTAGLTYAILETCPNVELLITIDPWKHVEDGNYESGRPQEQHNAWMFGAIAKLKPYRGRAIICPCTSDKAVDFVRRCRPQEHWDFVWIDGHHSTEQVERDIRNYEAFIRSGGIVGGHDYQLCPDVKPGVDAVYDHVETGGDYTWWVIKP